MRRSRILALVAISTLVMCAALASSATAVTVQDATTHTALWTGDNVNGVSTNSKLVGNFFGVATTITCAQSSFVGNITTNPTANLSGLSWAGCKNQNGTTCDVLTLNTPWSNAMTFTSTSNLAITVPSNGGVKISASNCLPLNSVCTFGAGQTINLSWSNFGSSATVNQTVTSSTCGNGVWTGTYVGRTGSTVGSGNPLEVV